MDSGAKLGHYTISSLIGKGGMGEVYQAKDEKLGRQVAIKVLPEEFAQDTDRVARFRREAQLLASLNHPNIAAIHGLEETDGKHFLVLELVEGPTLGDRIKQGAIPVEETLTLALQIAEALEAAHEKGVVHRDLKPANIKVTPEGKVKVLDFGLAKAFAGDESGVDVANSPTLSMQATQLGMILGTAAYMSPEQARGENADQRADVWAFGIVLFEMLTGRSTFTGRNVSDILASVLKIDPEWSNLPHNLHPRLRELLERCLEKEVKDRYQAIPDARVDIQKVLADPRGVIVQPVAEVVQAAPQSKLPWVAAIVMTAIVASLTWFLMQPDPQPLVRLTAVHPGTEVPGLQNDTDVVLSPDGTRLVYATGRPGEGRTYVRALDQLEPTLLVEAGRSLSLSPDGQWVGFVNQGTLSKVAINGGPTVPIAPIVGAPRGTTWGLDETIVFATNDQSTGLLSVPAEGGEPVVLTTPDSENGEAAHIFPQFLPGGRAVLFTITNNQSIENSQIALLDLETGDYEVLIQGGSDARYAASGHIVYGVAGTLRAVPFDLSSLEVRGAPVPILESVVTKVSGAASFTVSTDGTLAYIDGPIASAASRILVWVDREGNEEAVNAEPRGYWYPRISPDGNRVALDVRGGQSDILVWDFTRETLTRFTPTETPEDYPVWTPPDGQRIAYGTPDAAMWKASDGSGVAEIIFEGDDPSLYFFSLTGTELVFRTNADDVGMVSTDGNGDPEWLLNSEFSERNAEMSPDGNWMAYQSDESGEYEIYVSPFPDVAGGKQQVSNAGGIFPVWARNGQELFYVENGEPAHLMAVPVQTGSTFNPGNPEAVFEWNYYTGTLGRTYDVSPDGLRFLMIKGATGGPDATRPQINIVQNWSEELKERVPVP